MVTNKMLTLVDEAVAMLLDARELAITADDAPTRRLLSNVIGRIEAYRFDLEQKYSQPVCETCSCCTCLSDHAK